jgi:hypothetical protein
MVHVSIGVQVSKGRVVLTCDDFTIMEFLIRQLILNITVSPLDLFAWLKLESIWCKVLAG